MTTYGLQLPKFTFPVPDDRLFELVAAMATAADDGGFSSLWVMDHFYQLPGLGGADDKMLEGYTLLGALAARTKKVTLGTLVTGVTYRNPSLLAKEVTTLDVISSGRAVLGIGAAWYDVEHEGLGVDFPPVPERMDRLEEAVQICRLMFTEERPTFEGRYYRIKEARNIPRPIQAGGPPIMIGGSGPKRTLRAVAKYADMCNVFGGPDTLRKNLEILHNHCADVGRDPSEIKVTRLGSLFLTRSADEAKELRDGVAGAMGEEWAREAATFGDADSVGEQLRALVDAGAQELIFNLPLANDADDVTAAGEVLKKALA
ncbi:MAG TPA: LLM class F420-dependent oxidoreductase [Acidimicrobiales bacterium]|jgi:F420-dependent oxidoreductase-like protein|nr:LLM class F420-dependent oxidoreductase [Acidimicrobiales bacterium]